MDVHSGRWTARAGWSTPLPAWDSEATLVVAFGPSTLLDAPAHPALHDLRAAYPHAVVTGCSTAGEVLDDDLDDDTLVVAVLRFVATRVVAVCTDGGGRDDALRLADRIAVAVAQPVALAAGTARVTTSIGVALTADGRIPPDALMVQADAAIYRAKAGGRSRTVLADALPTPA